MAVVKCKMCGGDLNINHILGITENSLSILTSLVEYIDNPVAKALTNIVVKFREIEEKTNG